MTLALPHTGVIATLAAAYALSILVRAFAAWHKATPAYIPDEYLYAELGRSLADTGAPTVRGFGTGFPALLQPVLTAPFWLLGDTVLSYHAIQVFGVVAMSLVVVPVYVLARRLGLGAAVAVGCSAFALAIPDFLYASKMLAEPFAYPIALGAVAAGTLALARGGARLQLLFVVLVGLATLARVQFLILPLAFVVGAATLAIHERAPRRILREQALPLAIFGSGFLLVVVQRGLVGQYGAFLDLDVGLGLAERVAVNAYGFAYATGWLLVPGAILGLVLAIARPRSREEVAFAAFGGFFSFGLLAEAAAYGDLGRIQQRYFFYAFPILALLFGLYAARGWPHRRALGLLSVCALAAVALVPLTFATAAESKSQSAFLFAAYRLELAVGDAGEGALVLAAAVSALLLVTLAFSLRRHTGAGALALASSFLALASLGALNFDLTNTSLLRDRYLPAERTWIDDEGLENVALVHLFERRGDTYQQLFWNRSVDSLLVRSNVLPPDVYRIGWLTIGSDGALRVEGRPIVQPLVVDEDGGRAEFRGAVTVARAQSHRLWRPTGVPRLRFLVEDYYGGSLGLRGAFRAWPTEPAGKVSGYVVFRATPRFQTTLTISQNGRKRDYRLERGKALSISIPMCGTGPQAATFESDKSAWLGSYLVSTEASVPRFRDDPAACAALPG